jgi:antitoxin component YwqK of YwqJK toxin-antitoxin module
MYVILLFLISAFQGLSQNQLDEQGRKTGPWKVEYPNGKLLYEATFSEGKPVGEMIRYYDNGAVRARMMFDASGKKSYTHLFYMGGKPAAEGWYVDQVKDSVWTYYSEFDGSVRIREPYEQGKLHGIVFSYYPGGDISEEVSWDMHRKEGLWKQYYQNGSTRLVGNYRDNLLQGAYKIYYSDGTPKISGTYLDNKSHGTWSYFDENGEEVYSLEYVAGRPVDQETYDSWIQDSLSKYEVIAEPESDQQF